MLRIWILLVDQIPTKSQQRIGYYKFNPGQTTGIWILPYDKLYGQQEKRHSRVYAFSSSFFPLRSEDSAFGAAPIPLSRSVPVRCSGACLRGITKARGGECAKPSAEKRRRVSRFARSGGAAARRPGRRPRPAPSWRTAAGTRRSNRGCRRASRGQPSSAYCRHSKRR